MNIYLLWNNNSRDYTILCVIVCANNEIDAKTIHPLEDEEIEVWGENGDDVTNGWCNQEEVEIELLGIADKSIEHGVVVYFDNRE